jgi:hypothetical protein
MLGGRSRLFMPLQLRHADCRQPSLDRAGVLRQVSEIPIVET